MELFIHLCGPGRKKGLDSLIFQFEMCFMNVSCELLLFVFPDEQDNR